MPACMSASRAPRARTPSRSSVLPVQPGIDGYCHIFRNPRVRTGASWRLNSRGCSRRPGRAEDRGLGHVARPSRPRRRPVRQDARASPGGRRASDSPGRGVGRRLRVMCVRGALDQVGGRRRSARRSWPCAHARPLEGLVGASSPSRPPTPAPTPHVVGRSDGRPVSSRGSGSPLPPRREHRVADRRPRQGPATCEVVRLEVTDPAFRTGSGFGRDGRVLTELEGSLPSTCPTRNGCAELPVPRSQ